MNADGKRMTGGGEGEVLSDLRSLPIEGKVATEVQFIFVAQMESGFGKQRRSKGREGNWLSRLCRCKVVGGSVGREWKTSNVFGRSDDARARFR